MKERQYKIIHTLLYSASPVPLSEFQKTIGVSERTLKYDLANIRKEFKPQGIKLLNKKGSGYYIAPDDKPVIIKEYTLGESNETNSAEIFNIFMYLLFVQSPISIRIISEDLFMSETTIKHYIKKSLSHQPLLNFIELKTNIISLTGNEREIRKAYLDILFKKIEKVDKNEVALKFEQILPYFDIPITKSTLRRIERILQKSVKKWNVWVSEEAYIRLVLHLFLVYARKEQSLIYSAEEISTFKQFKNEFEFSKDVLDAVFWGIVDPNECLNLTEVMVEYNVFIDDSIEEINETRLSLVVQKMIDSIKSQYPTYNIYEQEFIQDVTPHLRHTLRRYHLKVAENKNPLFYQVKQNYPRYYAIAKEMYTFFSKEFQLPFSENEVSYLTIYLYKNMSMKVKEKYYVYVVCGTGRGFSKLVQNRINNIFGNIEIISTLSSFHLLHQKEMAKADFIISTIHLSEVDIPVVKISSFLGKEDIVKIQRFIDYGAQFSLLPLPQHNDSFKEEWDTTNATLTKTDAKTFSNILLSLFSMMVELPSDYDINQEKILGITMHIIIALPRYFDSDIADDDQGLVEEVASIEKAHPMVAKAVKEYLEKLEKIIGKGIPYSERYAMYQYIINKGD